MRALLVILTISVVIGSILGIPLVLPRLQSHYVRLQHKSSEYYVELASACDAILAKHPLGTNELIAIPVTDPSLPPIVRDLSPLKVQLTPRGLWMMLDSDSHSGIGLDWQPKEHDTNVWKLDIVAESLEIVLYTRKR